MTKTSVHEWVEFAVDNEARFAHLKEVFQKLKADKDANDVGDDHRYLSLFDAEARAYFRWSTPEEDAEWAKRWFATPIDERWTDPSLERQWDFGSMIDALRSSEVLLLSCEMAGSDRARLKFQALSYPYGGTGWMQALVASFGFNVILIDDGGAAPHPP